MIRRLGPWAISAAIHGGLAVAAYFAIAGVVRPPKAPDPDATYSISIRPGGDGPKIDSTGSDGRSYGIPQDSVVIGDHPLEGVPDYKPAREGFALTSPASSSSSGGATDSYRRGPVVRFGVEAGGGGSGSGTGRGSGSGEGTDPGVEAVALETPSPAYPDAARRGHVQGVVIAEIKIGVDGQVSSARTAEGSGSPALDDAALAAVRAWRYRPATLNGKPVPSVRRVRFVFRLE